MSGLIAPDMMVLQSYFADAAKANPKLYEKQLTGCRKALSESPYPMIQNCWRLMQQHQAGIVQEHWLLGETMLTLQPADGEASLLGVGSNLSFPRSGVGTHISTPCRMELACLEEMMSFMMLAGACAVKASSSKMPPISVRRSSDNRNDRKPGHSPIP